MSNTQATSLPTTAEANNANLIAQLLKRNLAERAQYLSNQVFITKKSYYNGGLEKMIQTYMDDEYLIHSAFLCAVSVCSFYPVIYFLNKQGQSKMGRRLFDQLMMVAIMLMTFAHFLAEQKSLEHYSFIPLQSWHKLINVFLLIEQCSLVLYLGGLSKDVENALFGLNLILILVLQERDSVQGEIKYSVIPLAMNNAYLFLTNFMSLTRRSEDGAAHAGQPQGHIEQTCGASGFGNVPVPSSPSSSSCQDAARQKKEKVSGTAEPNKAKVACGMFWYMGSLVGYALMEAYHQGLHLNSSREMFYYTASETLFMVSMAMCYFYSWQTYAVDAEQEAFGTGDSTPQESLPATQGEVIAVDLSEVMRSVVANFSGCWRSILETLFCQRINAIWEPIFNKLESWTGRGGHMSSSAHNPSMKMGQSGNGQYGYSEVSTRDTLGMVLTPGDAGYSEDGTDEEGTNIFNHASRHQQPQSRRPFSKGQDAHGLEMAMAPGMMTPIEEEPHSMILDTASTASNNSRNFQRPQKDLIQEMSRQRENMLVSGVAGSAEPTFEL